MIDRESFDAIEHAATSRDAVSTHVIAKKKDFEVEVDDEIVEIFAIVKKKKKNSAFDASRDVVFDYFSDLL